MNTRILASVLIIGLVAAVAAAGVGTVTGAFFSDVETSSGNTLAAGKLDLKISNGQGWTDEDIVLVNLDDLKPSQPHYVKKYIKVVDNPAKVFLHITNIQCDQGVDTEPECEEEDGTWNGQTCDNEQNPEFDLDNYISYDLKVGDYLMIDEDDHLKLSNLESLWIPLGTVAANTEIVIEQSFHLQAEVTNWAQGDKCTFDEEFLAIQTNAPDPTDRSLWLILDNKDDNWDRVTGDGVWGLLGYKAASDEFNYDLLAKGLDADTDYCLIYYADPWPGNGNNGNAGTEIVCDKTDSDGILSTSGSVDLSIDIPQSDDANYPDGGKLWIVPESHYDKTNNKMSSWVPTEYLHEHHLITYDDTNA
ncbi:MAG: SipW-dependent-type signal peptide-containing protein [Candidatus Thorarchaeota archaeon]